MKNIINNPKLFILLIIKTAFSQTVWVEVSEDFWRVPKIYYEQLNKFIDSSYKVEKRKKHTA